ncbi:MAG: hypothetical protein Q8S32_16290 [Burkholderiaceae bacterium]|nr:hypothetical protein [Burkholderiaceae bacterium]
MRFIAFSFIFALALSACGGGGGNPGTCNGGAVTCSGETSAPPTNTQVGIPSTGSYSVTYSVTGVNTRAASVTYSTNQGGTAQEAVNLPYSKTQNFVDSNFLYISAQNSQAEGEITVSILVGGEVLKTTTSAGAFVIATASATCCK